MRGAECLAHRPGFLRAVHVGHAGGELHPMPQLRVPGVTCRPMPDSTERLLNLRAGQLDRKRSFRTLPAAA
jgi:hypothetical protein